jgi:hypothetical protein
MSQSFYNFLLSLEDNVIDITDDYVKECMTLYLELKTFWLKIEKLWNTTTPTISRNRK